LNVRGSVPGQASGSTELAEVSSPHVLKAALARLAEEETDADISRSSARPVLFGDTEMGRHLMVVYEEIDADTVYPVTAYEVPRRQRP
jgi:hypothetical protein